MNRPSAEEILAHLAMTRTEIEDLLTRSIRREADCLAAASAYEREQSLNQLLNLSQGKDCHYDRTTSGGAYAMWYQAQRVQDAVLALAEEFASAQVDDLRILDLGSGTGATWIAADLLERARVFLGGQPRTISITAVDSSAPMMTSAWRIWQHYHPMVDSCVAVTPKVASWAQFVDAGSEPLVVASYLFDASDRQRGIEVGRLLAEVLESHSSRRAIIISAPNKVHINAMALDALTDASPSWRHHLAPATPIWRGGLADLHQMRVGAYKDVPEDLHRMVTQPPSWGERSATVTKLTRLIDGTGDQRRPSATFVLDEAQDTAATPDNRLTAVVGAAGSGKSRVLVERIMRIVAAEMQVPSMLSTEILLTTFNKKMLNQLSQWIQQGWSSFPGVPEPKVVGDTTKGDGTITFDDRVKVTLLNWDKVPTRLFGVSPRPISASTPASWEKIFDNWINCAPDNSLNRRKWLQDNEWVTAEFVQAEIDRVVYDSDVRSRDEYLAVPRTGRAKKLPGTDADRAVLWSLMVDDRAEVLFVDQRRKMLSHIKAGQPARTTFHHVFVDEAQDLLPVEYDAVLTRLVDDASSIVVGLDVTQALHTGSSFRRPGLLAGLNGTRRRWKIHELAGSYRLPIAICEALEPLAGRILTDRQTVRRTSMSAGNETPVGSTSLDEVDPEDLVRPSSRKSALIGVRPIILAPANTADLAVQFAEVLSTHRPVVAAPGATLEVTYAESTADEARELNDRLAHQHNGNRTSISARVEKDTMLEIKGLERSVVLWNSKMAVNRIAASDVAEWVYTILTRTTGLLVIALSIGTPPEVRDLITCLRRDRLLFWDRAAEERFDAWNLNTRVLTG